MALVTRVLENTEGPITSPAGVVLEDTQIIFQLVDADKRQPVSLFDAATGGEEYVVGSPVTATTDAAGLFSVSLWPNNRGELATLYKVTLPGTTIKPFYIRVSEGEGVLTFLAAKAAAEALQPQTLSLFESLLANILALVGTATAVVTQTVNGLMSYTDKIKLDGIDISTLVPKTTTVNAKALTGNITLVKGDIGLGNVDNTSDANKPISTAAATALAGKSSVSGPGAAQAFSVGALSSTSVTSTGKVAGATGSFHSGGVGVGLGLFSSKACVLGMDTAFSVYNDLDIRCRSTAQLYLNTAGKVFVGGNTDNGSGAVFQVTGGSHTSGSHVMAGGANITCPTYADNAAAITGGLSAGAIYKTTTGVLMVRY
jgi:hypothetical protein